MRLELKPINRARLVAEIRGSDTLRIRNDDFPEDRSPDTVATEQIRTGLTLPQTTQVVRSGTLARF